MHYFITGPSQNGLANTNVTFADERPGELVAEDLSPDWPEDYFDSVFGGWVGDFAWPEQLD